MVTTRAPEGAPTFPATSVVCAEMLCDPAANALEGMLQLPAPSAVADPNEIAPSIRLTMAPGSAMPVNVGVVVFVKLSVLESPRVGRARSGLASTAGRAAWCRS